MMNRNAHSNTRGVSIDSEIKLYIDKLNLSSYNLIESDKMKALDTALEASTLSIKHEYHIGAAQANYCLGSAYFLEDKEKSLDCFNIALTYSRKARDTDCELKILKSLASINLSRGEYTLSEMHIKSALEIIDQNSDAESYAEFYNILAGVYHYTGRHLEIEGALKKVLDAFKKTGNVLSIAKTYCNIGVFLTGSGRYVESLEYITLAYNTLTNDISSERLRIVILINLGHVYSELEDYKKSCTYYFEALNLTRLINDLSNEVIVLLNLAVIQDKLSSYEDAENSYRETLLLARQSKNRQGEISSLDGLGNLLVKRGEYALGVAALREALALAQSLEDLEGELDILMHLGQAHTQREAWAEALETLNTALERATQAGRPKAVLEAHRALYTTYKGMNDLGQALSHFELLYTQERALMSEESEKRVQELSARFNLERSQQEAHLERLLRETAEEARNQALEQVEQRTLELEQTQLEVVTRLAVAAEYRDDLTGEHTQRVGHYAALIAEQLGQDAQTVETLRNAARLHDVGKIGIPDDILHKPGKLMPEEFEFMKSHTRMGARILSGGQSRLLRMAEEVALSHHERWDGAGYPLGLSGEAIPLLGRIVAAADVFDALTHERPYKKAWTPQEALGELERGSGSQFDPQVVQAALEVLGKALD